MSKRKVKPLFTSSEWTFPMLERTMDVVGEYAKELKLNIYPNQLEMISSEQMLDAYSSVGLPVMYRHWSFGKQFTRESEQYRTGKRGLAYEIVINSNPCIAYLMEENTACMQALVIAHASFGHNHFFKNNHLFKEWTDASSIVDYLVFARNYLTQCEEKYGLEAVERTIDSAHALQSHGVDKYRRPSKISLAKEKERQDERAEYLQSQVNALWWSTVPKKVEPEKLLTEAFPKDPEENILYFLEKHSPDLKPWQREVIRIVRKVAQYFYPQGQTKVMNEGFATFTHHYLMNRMWEDGYITDGGMLEFMASHSNVTWQPDFNDSRYGGGLNPYHLGFELFTDIKRMCENPDDEDRELFPTIAGTDWRDTILTAVEDYRDESFIRQFLGPKVVQKLRLFALEDVKHESSFFRVKSIHDRAGLVGVRSALANNYELDNHNPKLEIVNVNKRGDRKLTIAYSAKRGRQLGHSLGRVLTHLQRLWGYPVEVIDNDTGKLLGKAE